LQKVSDVTGFLCKGSSVYKVSGVGEVWRASFLM